MTGPHTCDDTTLALAISNHLTKNPDDWQALTWTCLGCSKDNPGGGEHCSQKDCQENPCSSRGWALQNTLNKLSEELAPTGDPVTHTAMELMSVKLIVDLLFTRTSDVKEVEECFARSNLGWGDEVELFTSMKQGTKPVNISGDSEDDTATTTNQAPPVTDTPATYPSTDIRMRNTKPATSHTTNTTSSRTVTTTDTITTTVPLTSSQRRQLLSKPGPRAISYQSIRNTNSTTTTPTKPHTTTTTHKKPPAATTTTPTKPRTATTTHTKPRTTTTTHTKPNTTTTTTKKPSTTTTNATKSRTTTTNTTKSHSTTTNPTRPRTTTTSTYLPRYATTPTCPSAMFWWCKDGHCGFSNVTRNYYCRGCGKTRDYSPSRSGRNMRE